MNVNLYSSNTPAAFWKLQLDQAPTEADWSAAVVQAAPVLPPAALAGPRDSSSLALQTLGEGQFGANHWHLPLARRAYYRVKPFLPRRVINTLRHSTRNYARGDTGLGWPIEPRFAAYQYQTLRCLLEHARVREADFIDFWPHGREFALVLTHDIETAAGQAFVPRLADLEESLNFRSSFNFVAGQYPLDHALMEDLRRRGFEIGVHGYKHDGKLFRSWAQFEREAEHINDSLGEFGAVGFRSPLTHRHPVWMQALHIDYDLSFFDTDPYEPMPGGTMSLWPFALGIFMELPYTLPQDYTVLKLLGERTPRLWLEKVAFIARHHGMALVNSHPDYLQAPEAWSVYEGFLSQLQAARGYWHALPREVAAWWRRRMTAASPADLPGAVLARARVSGDRLEVISRPAVPSLT